MSVSYVLKSGALAALIACLGVGIAHAQLQDQQRQQQDRERIQPGQSPTERQTQRQFDRQAGQNNQGDQEVDNFLAQCLLAKNKAEIEISEIATQEASDQQVKQFAQKMVQEHRDLVQKLEQVANGQMSSQRQRPQPGGLGAQQLQQRQAQQSAQQIDPTQPQRDPTQPGQGLTDRPLPGRSGQAGSQNEAIDQLVRIEQQITQKATDAVTEKLREKSGADFDQAYLGCQVGAHMHMKAALEVIAQQTSGQLAQLAEQTQQKVEQHLEEAERLMKQTEDGARQAQRQRPSQRE
jgi:predicted outer membrane protein